MSNFYGISGRRSKSLRALLFANHLLHWISAIVVTSIAAWFLARWSEKKYYDRVIVPLDNAHPMCFYRQNKLSSFQLNDQTHYIYWVTVGTLAIALLFPALFLPLMKSYRGHLAPLTWIFSYLWLTAFILACQDFDFGFCSGSSPKYTRKCSYKRILEAFTFIAFITSVFGTAVESSIFHRSTGGRPYDLEKLPAGTPRHDAPAPSNSPAPAPAQTPAPATNQTLPAAVHNAPAPTASISPAPTV